MFLIERRDQNKHQAGEWNAKDNASEYKVLYKDDQTSWEDHHRAQEIEFWRWQAHPDREKNKLGVLTTLVALAALAAATFSAQETYRQANSAQDQLTLALDDQRPWVKISVRPRDISYVKFQTQLTPLGGEKFAPEIITKNIGKSPARDVRTILRQLSNIPQNLFSLQDQACADAANYPPQMLFPDDQIDTSDQGFGFTTGLTAGEDDHPFEIMIYGCTLYKNSRLSASYRTKFAYRVAKRYKINDTLIGQDYNFKLGDNILADNIYFTPINNGNYGD